VGFILKKDSAKHFFFTKYFTKSIQKLVWKLVLGKYLASFFVVVANTTWFDIW